MTKMATCDCNFPVLERVHTCKYLGIFFNDRIIWSDHVDLLMNKLSPRVYCMRKLHSFKVNTDVVRMFLYQWYVVFGVTVWWVGVGMLG